VLDDATRALLESGSSTILGLVDRAGEPFATRGWGSVVLDGDPIRLRVLVGAAAFTAAGYHLGDDARFAVAVTGADVRTLVSVQVKGTAVSLEPSTGEDVHRSQRFCADFAEAVEEADNIDGTLVHRLLPVDLWACTVEVAEAYDQTPGPGAGRQLA
jgi:hypothetical protein